MFSTGPFQFRWLEGYIHSSCYYHHQIGSINLTFCRIFSVAVCLRCLLHLALSFIAYTFRENRDFVFIIIVQFMMSANNRIRFALQIVFVCLYITPSHYHHCANLFEDIALIKCLWDVSSVWVFKLSMFSPLSIVHYMGLCVFSLPVSLVTTERIYTLSYYHNQIGSMNYTHCLGLGNETMVWAVCLSIFFWRRKWLKTIENRYLFKMFVLICRSRLLLTIYTINMFIGWING